MRTFRTAAIAAATAVTLTASGVTAASAQEQADSSSLPVTSSRIGKESGAWQVEDGAGVIKDENQVTGTDLLGSVTYDDNPEWAEAWKSAAYVGVAGSVIGAIIAGVNWLKFQGILPY